VRRVRFWFNSFVRLKDGLLQSESFGFGTGGRIRESLRKIDFSTFGPGKNAFGYCEEYDKVGRKRLKVVLKVLSVRNGEPSRTQTRYKIRS
jgi:hypothetical protein